MQDEKQKVSAHNDQQTMCVFVCVCVHACVCVFVCEQVVRKCNEGARTMERTEMMYTINSQLEFKIKV